MIEDLGDLYIEGFGCQKFQGLWDNKLGNKWIELLLNGVLDYWEIKRFGD